jgi:hypothetical protein
MNKQIERTNIEFAKRVAFLEGREFTKRAVEGLKASLAHNQFAFYLHYARMHRDVIRLSIEHEKPIGALTTVRVGDWFNIVGNKSIEFWDEKKIYVRVQALEIVLGEFDAFITVAGKTHVKFRWEL